MRRLVSAASNRAHEKRAKLLRGRFQIGPDTRILDLGGNDGSHIAQALAGSGYRRSNVFVADVATDALLEAKSRGFQPVPLTGEGPLPFGDSEFDVVFCSSVIEHVAMTEEVCWEIESGSEFRETCLPVQQTFAQEIARIGRGYFVQTPDPLFPVEAHSWLPFASYLPRPLLIRTLRFTNPWWIKPTYPDFHLLRERELASMFPDADIHHERFLGLPKSLIAVKVPPPEPRRDP